MLLITVVNLKFTFLKQYTLINYKKKIATNYNISVKFEVKLNMN